MYFLIVLLGVSLKKSRASTKSCLPDRIRVRHQLRQTECGKYDFEEGTPVKLLGLLFFLSKLKRIQILPSKTSNAYDTVIDRYCCTGGTQLV